MKNSKGEKRKNRTQAQRVKFQWAETTMPVPCGEHSFFNALLTGVLQPIETMQLLYAHHSSNYASGKTNRFITSKENADVFGVTRNYIRRVVRGLTGGWMETLKTQNEGKRWQIHHYRCEVEDIPTDMLGDPLTFPVPRGTGGPVERWKAGDISRNACLIWMVLKYVGAWETAIVSINMATLAKMMQMSKQTVCNLIKELEAAGMLERLSKPWETSKFQLYPKPRPKKPSEKVKEKHERRKKQTVKISGWDVHVDAWHATSHNYQWRISLEDGTWEKRKGKSWEKVKDRDLHTIPKAVERDLNMALEVRQATNRLGYWGGPESDTPSPLSDTPGVESDTLPFAEGYKPAWDRG